MESPAPSLLVSGTLHKEHKKGRGTLRGRNTKSLWFQKQGGRLYYVSKRPPDNGAELNESNAKGFISSEAILNMFEVKDESAAPAKDRQLELVTTEGRIVLNFPLSADLDAWMSELQAHLNQAIVSPRSGRKYTMEDVSRSGYPTKGTEQEEDKKRGTLGNFIRSKTSRRKRSSSDKEKKEKGEGADDDDVADQSVNHGSMSAAAEGGRKRPPLPFSFRSSNPNKEKSPTAPATSGVQVITTFSSGVVPSDIRSMLSGLVPSGTSSAASPRGSPATSTPPSSDGQPTSTETGTEDPAPVKEEANKKGSGRQRAPSPTSSVVDSPKLVHAATAPYSPATMYAQVVKESTTSTSKVLFLPGEDLKAGIRNVLLLLRGRAETAREGSLYITNYRLLWRNPSDRNDTISIPFRCIRDSELSANQECIFIECADFRNLEVYCKGPAGMHPDKKRIMQYEDQKTLRRELKAHLASQTSADLFAFQNKERFESLEAEVKGWPIFEIRVEAARWKIPLDKWQFVENAKFKLCSTYPPHILLPSFLSKKALANSFDAYNEKRIVALCWKDSQFDKVLLFRSAIPRQYTLISDVARVMSYPTINLFHITHPPDKKGGLAGVSDHEHNYDVSDEHLSVLSVTKEDILCEDEHINVTKLELPSAAAVGLSFTRLKKAVTEISFITPNDRENWVPALKATRWLHHLRRLLDIVAKGVAVLHHAKEPLIIQNIDGSNCIPQVTSLIQLCMDPFYRTFEGFSILIEKEWISFNHNFGQSPKKANSKEVKKDKANMAHMFVQFMDGVWQLWSQFPRSFQFSESYLLFVLDSLYSARFGTFLGNNFKQRHKHKLVSSTVSLWSYLYTHRDSYRNPLYNPPDSKSATGSRTLNVAPLLVKFWSGYFLQHQCRDTLKHASLIIDASLGPRDAYPHVEETIPSSSTSSSRTSSPNSSLILSSLRSPMSASPTTESEDLSLSISESPRSVTSISPSPTDGESFLASATPSSSTEAVHDSASPIQYMTTLSLARKGLHSMANELADAKDRRLARVTQLDLSSNILSYFAFPVAHYGRLEVLNLSDNEFREIPELLAQSFAGLTRLRELDISNNKIYHLPAQLSLLRNLTRLEASHNRLLYHKQQQEIDQINLENENTGGVQRRTLDSFDFASLAQSLQYLSISFNSRKRVSSGQQPQSFSVARFSLSAAASHDLHTFPRSLMALTNLTSLKFNGNNIPYLPSAFFSTFKGLRELDMGNNPITILPSGLGNLQLTSLNLSNIELKELIPPDLYQLGGSLRQLYAQGLRLLKVPAGFSALTALEILDLSHNDLTTFSESLLQLTNLQQLFLSQNNINSIPTGIKHLKNLERLYLDKNDLHSLVPEIGFCKALGVLNISDNKIKELPPQLGALPNLRRLVIGKNMPLVSPPISVESEGEEAVLSFIKQFINGFERCFRYKLMVVGQENVGKSTLLRCLNHHRTSRKGEALPNISTDGIEIGTAEWTIKVTRENETKEITLTTWDFAGQEVYYSTHHMFLTERSLFLLVTDVSKPLEFSRLDFWLESIRSRTKNAHVIVVGTHIDDKICTSDYLEAKEKEIKSKYLARYPNIHSTCFISCSTGKNMSSLIAKIEEALAGEIHLGEFLPKSYLELERMIIQQRKNRVQEGLPPIALWSEYKSWAELCMISNEKELLVATCFLHNLGSLLYFAEDENLLDVVILDPQWLATVMSTIITTKHNYLGRDGYEGILQHSVLPFIWRPPTFPNDLHGFFLYLLNKFEIAFTLEEGEEDDAPEEESETKPSILAFLPTASSSPSLSVPEKNTQRLSKRLSTSAPIAHSDPGSGSRSRSPSIVSSAPPELAAAKPPDVPETVTPSAEVATVDAPPPMLKRRTTRELLSELINRPIARKMKSKGYSLIPALLPNKRPDDLASVWPLRYEGDGILEYGRIYTFDFAPTGFFAKAMVRLLSFRLPQILKYWRNGLLLSSGSEKVFVEFNPSQKVLTVSIRAEDKDLPETTPTRHNEVATRRATIAVTAIPQQAATLEEKPGEKNRTLRRKGSKKAKQDRNQDHIDNPGLTDPPKRVMIRTGSERDAIYDGDVDSQHITASEESQTLLQTEEDAEPSMPRFQLLSLLVFSTIDALIRDWFKLEAQVTVPCPHCAAANLPNPSTFSFTELQRALVQENESAYIICNNGNKFGFAQLIRIDRLVPDVAMLHLEDAKIEFSEITIDEEIGSGGFAQLYKGRWRDEVVAVKKFKFTEDETLSSEDILQALEEFRQEVWIMGGLHHPNIVGLRAFCMDPCCIVEELVTGGNMLSYLHSPAPLDWPLRLKMLKDVAKGCAFLHSTTPPVMHRDLKTPNILLVSTEPDAELVAKVCDFGVSINSSSAAVGRKVDCPLWLAPEVMMGMPYTGKADVYSFGVICWESITRKRFFDSIGFMSMIESRVIAGERPPIPADTHPEFAELIQACWHQDPNKRPTFTQVVEQLTLIMARYCPAQADYDKNVAAKEEALEKQRQERNHQYKLQQQKEEDEANEEEPKKTGTTIPVSEVAASAPIKQQRKWVQRRRGPSLNVLQDKSGGNKTNGPTSSISAESRRAMLDQLRSMSALHNRRLPDMLALALPAEEQANATTVCDDTKDLVSSDISAGEAETTPRTEDSASEQPAEADSASSTRAAASPVLHQPPPSSTDTPKPPPVPSVVIVNAAPEGSTEEPEGPLVVVIPSVQEDEAKLKEKEDRKRRVEEIRQRISMRGTAAQGAISPRDQQPGVRSLPTPPARPASTDLQRPQQ